MQAEYNSNEITARVIEYYDKIVDGISTLQPTGSIDPDKYPVGATLIDAFGVLDPETTIPQQCRYGTVIHINNRSADGTVEIVIPYTPSSTANITKPIYVRNRTDRCVEKQQGWSEWRRLVYADEIEYYVLEILRAKGLIT